jgi:DNA-binding NtrC family response regulator/tetratricopeptide (TPR) repeat protein
MVTSDPLGKRADDDYACGLAALEAGRFEEAIDYFRSALHKAHHSAEQEALIRCGLSEALERCGKTEEQLKTVAKYDNFADFVRLPERIQMEALIRLGWAHSADDNIPRAIALFNQAIRIARRLEDQSGIGACYFGLGRVYRVVSEIRIARDHYASALDHFRRTDNWRYIAESYFNIGNIDAREGNYRIALQSMQQALAIIGEREEPDLLGRVYHDLALIYDNLELPTNRALESWEKCIDYFRKAGNTFYLAFNYNNFASKLISLGDWTRAEQMARASIDLLSGSSRLAQLGTTLDTLAQLYLLRGQLSEADRLLEQSLEAFSKVKEAKQPITREFPLESSTHITIGRCSLIRGQIDDAIEHLQRAVDISLRLGDRQFLSESRLWLAEALLQAGQIEASRATASAVQSDLRHSPDMLVWGLLMRVQSKLEASDGHIASAVQSLGQSTSIFEIKGNTHDLAVNCLVLARLLESRGQIADAIDQATLALNRFSLLGALIDQEQARGYIESLQESSSHSISQYAPALDEVGETADLRGALASVIDGFIAQRLVQASVSRDLLLYELAAITHERAGSRGALVAQVITSDSGSSRPFSTFNVIAYIELDDDALNEEQELLMRLSPQDYPRNYVYKFSDKNQSEFILKIVEPTSTRFINDAVTLEPLLRLVEQGLENDVLRSRNRRSEPPNAARLLTQAELPDFICASRAMNRVLEQIHKIRSSDVTVLITGESGTGKELIARAVHAGSSRRFNTFLPFNCSAAPREMVESQLFGHRKGAFTGAVDSNRGIIRAAERGTLFLDEVGDLPLELQPKLLRFLQEGEVHPLGESQPVQVDVRVVAATNSDLEQAVLEGRFREDLFHRLNVIRVQVPPLRERREEIPALIEHYLGVYQQEAGKTGIKLAEEASDLLVVYDWPGNVRQLCNELRRIVTYRDSGEIVTSDSLSSEIVEAGLDLHGRSAKSVESVSLEAIQDELITLPEAIEHLEKNMIRDALQQSKGNITRAARQLGLTRKGLYLKMDRFNFDS